MSPSFRRVYQLVALLMVASMLVACGGLTPPPPATDAPAQQQAQPTSAPAATAQPQASAAPAQPTAAAAPTTAPAATKAPAAQAGTPKPGGSVIVTSAEDLESLDPPLATSTLDWFSISQVLYNSLYDFDDQQKITPDLAEALPQISADGKVYTIKLKKGVLFHNGREMVAADVKYSIERNAKPDAQSWNATAPMSNIVGGQDVLDGKADTAAGIKVVDDNTIEFTLLTPDAYFLAALTLTTNAIVPKEAVEKWGQDFGFHPVGTGPFMFKEWTPKQKVVFVRNPKYFVQGQPFLDQITYEIGAAPEVSLLRWERGEVDLLGDGVPSGEIARIAADPKLGQYLGPEQSLLMYFIGFNTKTAPFDNVKVRQAIAMAINRDRLIPLTTNSGTVANDWLPATDFPCNNKDGKALYPYDPTAAKKLLAEAGVGDGFTVDVWFRQSRPWMSRVPEALQQDLAAIGVKVNLQQLEGSVGNQQMNDGKLAMFANSWGASFADPYNWGVELWSSDSVYAKRFRYANPEVDKLVAQAKQNLDDKARCDQWLQAQDLVIKDLPGIPLYMLNTPSVRPIRLQGYHLNPANPGPPWATVWIEK